MRGRPRWENFTRLSQCIGTEIRIFDPLEDMFDPLIKCSIDGSFVRLGQRSAENVRKGSEPVPTADVGVSAEFKTNKNDKNIYDNSIKVVGASSHILNDDVRRMFTYGITIEDDEMTLWYFSRSHSVKSASFNYIEDLESFTAISLSFMFSSDKEMGYDPCVIRSKDGSNYIYHLEDQSGKKRYFQTHSLIAEYRSLCVTGRMTRVWEAIELDQEQTGEMGKPVVLKDLWLDGAAQTEKQIQNEIFRDIRSFPVSTLDSLEDLSNEMRAHLRKALANDRYKEYFLHIICDYRGETTKPLAPTASPKLGLFNAPVSTSAPSTTRSLSNPTRDPRQFVQRRQYRLVYNEVCETLHDLKSLKAIKTLQLLYCAGWVHRDISSGNILAHTVEGTIRGKLADLEYARKFASNSGNSDPKMGTPFFMPLEIQTQQYFSQPTRQRARTTATSTLTMERKATTSIRPPVRFNFQHDLESLWWVLLWAITEGPNHVPSRQFADTIFQNRLDASPRRKKVVTDVNYLLEAACFHPTVEGYGNSLSQCMIELYDFYNDREQAQLLEDVPSYAKAHFKMYELVWLWKTTLDGNEDVAVQLLLKRGPDIDNPSNLPQRMKPGRPTDDSNQPVQDDGGAPSRGLDWRPKRPRRSSGPSEDDGDYQPGGSDESDASQGNRRPKRPRRSFGFR
ncbi:hypothetical protein BD779DRAFT_1552665 [Infundibulicybe gibba]|nr:hypothetical protein BD779DRAFT_1552665 [Infundibulicybe gibba]